MSAVKIAFPVTRIKLRLQLYKGQSWSVVEHLILDSLMRQSRSVGELAIGFDLSRPIVEEALLRLMLVEWVVITTTSTGSVVFQATNFGCAAASHEELPSALRPSQRERWLLFERVTGHAFRVGDLQHIRRKDLPSQPGASRIVQLRSVLDQGRPEELADMALEEDEQLVGVEPTGEFVAERVALVEVVDGTISGLPADREVLELRKAILEAAASTPRGKAHIAHTAPTVTAAEAYKKHSIRFTPEDLIVGGSEHRETLLEILDTASSRVIIHSTFLSERRFLEFLGPMIKAIERGVQIDVLWGQDSPGEDEVGPRASRAEQAAQKLLEYPDVIAQGSRLRIYTESTRSHAKVIVADPAGPGQWQAILGSCNWLDTPFKKVEASVRVSGAGIIRDILRCLMGLVHGGGPWPDLVTELYQIAGSLRYQPAPAHANGTARLVSNDGHNDYLLRARDCVKRKLLLVSHRLGAHYDCGALLPLAAACRSRQIDARLLYSSRQSSQSRTTSQLERNAKANGIALRLIEEPQLHAKLLACDEDYILVTSQNWMSRDAGFSSLVGELGVAIHAPGAATALMAQLDDQVRRIR
jgi:cardiolipin synthase